MSERPREVLVRRLLSVLGLIGAGAVLASPTTTTTAAAQAPAAVPAQVAFVGRSAVGTDLYVDDGTRRVNLTKSPSVVERSPAFSPDGSRIAFSVDGSGLWVMDADGTGAVRLTTDPSDAWPSWSPDGSQLVFSRRGENFDLWRTNADGTGQVPVLEGSLNDVFPDWSPLGDAIFFAAVPAGIFSVAPDGSNLIQHRGYRNHVDFDYAPDAAQLVEAKGDESGGGDLNIAIRDAEAGSFDTELTTYPGTDRHPSWSPDGSLIAFTRFLPGGNAALFVMRPDGSGQRPITPVSPDLMESDATWNPAA
jgi:Tol biopolymer transport system component